LDLKGIGPGAFKNARSGAPVSQTGGSSLTFQSAIRIPEKMVGEWLVAKITVNSGAGTGTGTATVSSIVNKLIGQIEGNRFSFDQNTLVQATLMSQLLTKPFPGAIAPSDGYTDPVIVNAATDYTGIYKIAQGIPPGLLQLRLDTVTMQNAFTGLTLSATPTVTVEFVVLLQDAAIDERLSEYYLVSGEKASSVTTYEAEDVAMIVLVHDSASMAGYSIKATDGTEKTAADLASDESLATSRLSTGSYKLLPVVFEAEDVNVRITNSSAVTFCAIIVRNPEYTDGLRSDVISKYGGQ